MSTNQMGLVSKSKLTALATAIKTKAGVSGTYSLDDLVDVVDNIETGGFTPTGTKQVSITQNGTTTEDVTNYASAEITVDVPSSGITPSGTIQITENGTVDVTQYASANVNVPTGGGESISPYAAKVGTIVLESSGSITIPTPNIDRTQFIGLFFIRRDYATAAAEQFALGNKVNFGLRYVSFSEYQTASGQTNTKPAALRYGVDNTALNYYSTASVSIGTNAISCTNSYYQGTYDYAVIYKEVSS